MVLEEGPLGGIGVAVVLEDRPLGGIGVAVVLDKGPSGCIGVAVVLEEGPVGDICLGVKVFWLNDAGFGHEEALFGKLIFGSLVSSNC